MVHKKEEGTYHCIEKLMKEMPGFLSPRERLASPLNSWINKELIRNREFLTDPKQHIGSLLLMLPDNDAMFLIYRFSQPSSQSNFRTRLPYCPPQNPVVVVVESFSHIWLFGNPMDCSPPGSFVHGISQARIPCTQRSLSILPDLGLRHSLRYVLSL